MTQSMMDFLMQNKFFVVLVLIALVYGIWDMYFRECPKCDGRLKLDDYDEPGTVKLTKHIRLITYKGPKKVTYYYRCNQCGYKMVKKRFEWN